jgi:serine/threonine-protein kinase
MGSVYLARARGVAGFERLVAVKRMKPEVMDRPNFAERFWDEAQLAAHVRHANVISVQHLGEDSEGLFLVLDYVEGASLDTLIDRCVDMGGRPPPPIALRIIADALAGLHAVHEATDSTGQPLNILHRDVSTQNIIVGRDGIARLSDFGVAKSTQARHVTENNRLFGRVLYMPPEYLHQSPIDRRLDVYAMGVTLFIALSGVEPWADATDVTLIGRILSEGVPTLASTGLQVAPELEALVKRATAKDPEDRFSSAAEMMKELETLARNAGWMGTQSEVAHFVEELEGRMLASRRTALASGATLLRTGDKSLPPAALEAETMEAAVPEKPKPAEEDRSSRVQPLPIKRVHAQPAPTRAPASRQGTSLGIGPSTLRSEAVEVVEPTPPPASLPTPQSLREARPSYGGGTRLGLGKPQAPLVGKVAHSRGRSSQPDTDDHIQLPKTKVPWVLIAAIAALVAGVLAALLYGR